MTNIPISPTFRVQGLKDISVIVAEAWQVRDVSVDRIAAYIASDIDPLPAVKIQGRWLAFEDDVRTWAKRQMLFRRNPINT